MKKIISFLLVLTTFLSCLILTVSAGETVATDEARLPFEDVKSDHWFESYLKFCYANGIIKGMNEYTFGHAGQLTRAQFVTMLANLEGVDTSVYSVAKFTDVKADHWYYGAVAWAYEEGIVSGMTESTFAPNGVLTRAQLATVMYNYMQDEYDVEVNDEVLDRFSDKPKAEFWYYDAMKYAVSAGLLSGMSDGTLSSTGVVTRAQAVVIFESFVKNYFHADCEHSFSEADCTNPSACTLCGMKQGLAKGHVLSSYDCDTPGYCLTCGVAVPASKILHSFEDATCTAPRTCALCGDTRGEAKGHKWVSATCTVPKTCSVCKESEGDALGHTTSNGECYYCGAEFFTTNHARICHYIKKKGKEVGSYYKYAVDVTTDNGKKMTVELFYKPAEPAYGPFPQGEGSLTVRSKYYLNEANWVETRIYMNREQSTVEKYHSYTVMYWTYEFGDDYVSGSLRADNMTRDKIPMGFREGSSSLTEWDETRDAVYYTVKYFDYALRYLCGSDANEYHFYNIDG